MKRFNRIKNRVKASLHDYILIQKRLDRYYSVASEIIFFLPLLDQSRNSLSPTKAAELLG
jgi:hypothetical protein